MTRIWRVAKTEHMYRDFPTREAAREFARRVRVYGPVTVGRVTDTARAPGADRPAQEQPRRRGRSR